MANAVGKLLVLLGIVELLIPCIMLFAGVVSLEGFTSTPIYTCMSIELPGYYYLASNISGVSEISGWCIEIFASDVVLDGNGYGIVGDGRGGGIAIRWSSNTTIRNVKVSGYGTGISLLHSNGSTVTNVEVSNSSGCGIDVERSSRITIESVSVGSSGREGIYIYASSSIRVANTRVNNNHETGIKLIEVASGIIVNTTVVNNTAAGVSLHDSRGITVVNSTLSNNGCGIDLSGSSGSNIVANNIVSSNACGVQFSGYSSGNTFYNNYFKNTINVAFIEKNRQNAWNTTKTGGRNIVGGHIIGGNYWGSHEGAGFSDTCVDGDGDSICDEPFVIDESNVDHLPLKAVLALTPTPTQPLSAIPTVVRYTTIAVVGVIIVVIIVAVLILLRRSRG